MAYLGNQPSNNFVSLKRQVITGNGGSTYTLDHAVASVNDVAIFVNNVRQDPASYSISGTALTLGGTISSSDSCYVIFLGQALQTVTPDANTITNAMLGETITVANGGTGVTTASALANTGNLVLLSSQTASGDASINFTSDIDSTYKIYVFKFFDIHPSADEELTFQVSTDGGSNYNTTVIAGFHRIQLLTTDGSSATSAMDTNVNDVNVTTYSKLTRPITQSASNSASSSGELIIYNPSGTTFFKHFQSDVNTYGNFTQRAFKGGMFKTASAINAVSFKMDSGNIDAGTISMYGVKT